MHEITVIQTGARIDSLRESEKRDNVKGLVWAFFDRNDRTNRWMNFLCALTPVVGAL